MIGVKEQIRENLEFLNEEQLLELADFSAFLKVRSRIENLNLKNLSLFNKDSNEDIELSEFGMAEYNESLLNEDKL